MKHLKLFETEVQYESFKSGEDFILPNVSFVVENADVKFSPKVEKWGKVTVVPK